MNLKRLTLITLFFLAFPLYADNYLPSLVTATPYEGRQLAIKLARKSIGEIQSDPAVKKKIRGEYAHNGRALIAAAEVIALEFQTIAQANNYWRP